jgi:Tfp pilus assembly PilM family ATPase
VILWPFGEQPEDPRQALRQIDPDLRLPFSLAEAYLDLSPLPGQPTRSLLVAAPQAVVQAWIEVFSIAELAVDRLEPAQSCEWRCLQTLSTSADASELKVVLALEAEATRLLLVQRGMPVFERRLAPVGVPFRPNALGDLIVEVDRCRRFWQRQRAGVTSEVRWYLHGPLAGQSGLLQALEQAGVERVELIDPLQRSWLALPPDLPASWEGPQAAGLLRLGGLLQSEVRL